MMRRVMSLMLMMWFTSAVHALEFPPESQITNLGACCELQATVKFKYAIRPKSTARLTFPVLATNDENDYSYLFNDAVNELLQKEVNEFRERSKQASINAAKATDSEDRHYLSADYSVSAFRHANTTLLSVRFSLLQAKQGQEERGLMFRALNFNLATGEILSLDRFFIEPNAGLALIAEYVQDSLSVRLKDDSILKREGLSPQMENFSVWNALPTGMLFTFARGQVLPESWGTQTVLIPYDVFDGYADMNSSLGMCVKHPKRCRQALVLSGGFSEFKSIS